MKFYETSDHIKREIERKQRELDELRYKLSGAEIREFYWHLHDKCDTDDQAFLDAQYTLSFMGKSVNLNNYAQTFDSVCCLLAEYMDEDDIDYIRSNGGCGNE